MSLVAKFRQIIKSAYNYKEALERENLNHDDVEALRENLKSMEYVPKLIADEQLLLFLNACGSDIEKSRMLVQNYYKLRKEAPELFMNRDFRSDEIQNCLKHQDYVVLPITPDNCHLIFHRLSSHDAQHYNFDSAAKTFAMSTESSFFVNGPRSGIVFLFDLQGVGFYHLFKPSIKTMRNGIKLVEECMPVNIKAVHAFNSGFVFKMILAIVKPLVRSDMLNKVHFHASNLDYEKFNEEFVPKSHLPSDYGGDLKSASELHKEQCENSMELREYFLLEEMQSNFKFDDHEYLDQYKAEKELGDECHPRT